MIGKGPPARLQKYFDTIQGTLELIREDKKNIKSLLISDSTILISPDTKQDFKTLLKAVQTVQAKLAQNDIWIRGAISFGDVFYDQETNIVVGKGLVSAYLLESQVIYPRVIINPSIIPRIANNKDGFYDFANPAYTDFSIDKLDLVNHFPNSNLEDAFFIAYAHRIILDSLRERNLHLIYKKIKGNLYSNPKHYAKFLWVKNYFYHTLSSLRFKWFHAAHNRELNLNIELEKTNIAYIEEWADKFFKL